MAERARRHLRALGFMDLSYHDSFAFEEGATEWNRYTFRRSGRRQGRGLKRGDSKRYTALWFVMVVASRAS